MKRLIVLCAVLSLGFAASAWACDGKHEDDKKDKSATQSQAVEKNDKAASAPVKNAQPTAQQNTASK